MGYSDAIALGVYVFTFLLGLPANLLVLFVYLRKACKRGATPNVVYALNLCLANLALVAWLPVKALETLLQDWRLPPAVCPAYSFFLYSSLYGSCLFLTAVAAGRYLSIAFPIAYKRYRRARLSCLVSAALWLSVLVHLSVGLLVEGGAGFVSVQGHSSLCFQRFNASPVWTPAWDELSILVPVRLELFVVLFCVPFLICCFCYANFILILSRLPNISRRRRLRAIGLALGTLLVFAVCFGPYNASHVVGYVRQESEGWRSVALMSSTFNACLDPFI
uniref:Free fatty acid receptor 1 n=1 Tax=Tetraodon nigroviridis TaxID=99883 RepID=H3CAB6_TETNG